MRVLSLTTGKDLTTWMMKKNSSLLKSPKVFYQCEWDWHSTQTIYDCGYLTYQIINNNYWERERERCGLVKNACPYPLHKDFFKILSRYSWESFSTHKKQTEMITKSPSEYKRNVNKRFWCGTQIYNQKKNRFFEMYFRRLSESNSKKKIMKQFRRNAF